jgi:beta-glucanase (GH16 family)
MAARIRTVNSFSFKYGRVEVNAKMPTGDWLWPGKFIKF